MLLELGNYYVSDFVKEQSEDRVKYNLDLFADDEIGAVRIKEQPPHSSMWGQYWYRSGINLSMKKELSSIVSEIVSRVKLKDNDVWLDIACNDGTLLKNIPDNVIKVGIDPADNSYVEESEKFATIIQDYFSKEAYDKSGITDRAKVISCIAMFYDLDDPKPFIKDLYEVLDDNGLLVLQMSYTPLMIKQLAFDNICHEHVYYYDLTSISKLFKSQGFNVVDCSLNDTNGGSFRIYLQKDVAKINSFATAPLRDVCNVRIQSILEYEKLYPLTSSALWKDFGDRLSTLKSDVVDFIRQAKSEGKIIWGYGASTKGNTLLQYFGLTNQDIDAIAERSPYKFGLKTVGTDIPIKSEDEMREANPDYLLVLPWHFIDEFQVREIDFLKSGGSFIVPCPKFEIISL
jgi:cyclopropane fatty-acyl-phospholipid synthase-like methyltransferase